MAISKSNWNDDYLFKGNSSAEFIFNYGSQVTIIAGADNDTIDNSGSNVLFKYAKGDGNDSIYGFNETSTLQITSGKMDSIVTSNGYDYFLSIGDETITLKNAFHLDKVNIVNSKGKSIKFNVKFVGTDNNDRIYNSKHKSNLSIVGGAGNDTIDNSFGTFPLTFPNNVTIDAGTGNDEIQNGGENVLFKYSGGDDTIKGFNDTSTLQIASGKFNSVIATNGTDYFVSVGDNTIRLNDVASLNRVKIVNSKGKALNFSVKMMGSSHNWEDNITINGTEKIDLLKNGGDKVTILGYGGDDTITNAGGNVSINSGTGADSITNLGETVKINSDTGDDWIYNYGEKVTINSGADDDGIINYGANVSINGGTGNYGIYNYGEKVTILGGSGNDYISNHKGADKVTIKGGGGNDRLFGSSGKDKLYGEAGKDELSGGDGKDTLSGGMGNDSLLGDAGDDSLSGGTGNDSLFGGSEDDTLWGGKGNDSLWGDDGEDVFIYKPGEGTDTIFDYTSDDMLKILKADGSAGTFSKSNFSDGVLTLTISGGGSVIFENVSADDSIKINSKTYTIGETKLK